MPQLGKLESIGLRPAKKEELVFVAKANLNIENGLAGDHYHSNKAKRQVTLIQDEHLAAVSNIMNLNKDSMPALTRRNLVISGINLLSFKEKKFKIGKEVILEMTGLCHPCTRMEKNLGAGGLNAMRGHGGICSKVINGGPIQIGDEVSLLED